MKGGGLSSVTVVYCAIGEHMEMGSRRIDVGSHATGAGAVRTRSSATRMWNGSGAADRLAMRWRRGACGLAESLGLP